MGGYWDIKTQNSTVISKSRSQLILLSIQVNLDMVVGSIPHLVCAKLHTVGMFTFIILYCYVNCTQYTTNNTIVMVVLARTYWRAFLVLFGELARGKLFMMFLTLGIVTILHECTIDYGKTRKVPDRHS